MAGEYSGYAKIILQLLAKTVLFLRKRAPERLRLVETCI
jgi:hypothetical protein